MPLLPDILDTPRLRLRKPKESDAALIFASYGQDADVAHYMIWCPHTEVGQTLEFIRGCIASWEGEDRLPYVIVRQGQDEPIGMLDARVHRPMVDIGYVLAKSAWGHGLMPEAIEAVVDGLLASPSIDRVQATCDVDNKASRRALEKSGFKQEARLEQHAIHPNISPLPRACYMYARGRSAA
jgi:[ribosomal protein S5]-alanine N-acetyltransferase